VQWRAKDGRPWGRWPGGGGCLVWCLLRGGGRSACRCRETISLSCLSVDRANAGYWTGSPLGLAGVRVRLWACVGRRGSARRSCWSTWRRRHRVLALRGRRGLSLRWSWLTRACSSSALMVALAPDTRRLLLVAAADPFGDVAVLWGAAERLGIGAGAAAEAEAAGLMEIGSWVRFRHPLPSAVYRSGLASIDSRSIELWLR
jgi:hypothetical protein